MTASLPAASEPRPRSRGLRCRTSKPPIEALKITTEEERTAALEVMRRVFQEEKAWLDRVEMELRPLAELGDRQSWFLVRVGSEAGGVIRLVYDPPLELPAELEVEIEEGLDVEALKDRGRFAEIGRFMILPAHRGRFRVALELMKVAVVEVVERGYTHLLTDVFEDDPHSPLQFHTRVLGFERIGTHRYGELHCESLRIILLLDIARAYHRLKRNPNRIFRHVGAALSRALEGRLRQLA